MKGRAGALDEAFNLLTEIGIISQLSSAAFGRRMPRGLTISQFGVLNHLSRLGGEWTPVRLAEAMQVTKAAMTNTLGHLVEKRLVTIRPDDRDGRAKLVAVTDKGRAERDAAIAAIAPDLLALVEGVTPELIAELVPKLAVVRRFLDERRG